MDDRSAQHPSSETVDALLINPPWINRGESIWHGIKGAMPPLGLLSIAAYAEREGYRVRITDLHAEHWSIDEFREQLARIRPRVVGISMMTATAIAANRVARCVKEVHPEATVVVGGVHAEAMPTECLKNSAIDIVLRGDGEQTFSRILAGAPLKDILGLSYRSGSEAVHNLPAPVIDNLDSIPMPAYHLVPMHKYYPAMGAYRRLPAINMLMTRGCPGKCTFCNSAETKLRTRSAEHIVAEIEYLKRVYGIREIQFYDDTFTIFRANVLKFCTLMQERKVGVSWTGFVRTDCFNEELAREMKAAGCHQVMFGVESGDDAILERIKKPIDRARTAAAIRLAQRVGLEVRATFMFGNPGETVESMERTIAYAVELDPDLAIFNITTPYPGTQMFAWAKHHGYLNTGDWGEYELSGAIMTLPTVPPQQVEAAYRKAFKAFYNRPIVFWRRIKRVRSLSHFVDNVHAFFFIVLRRKVGKRGLVHREWVRALKEDFWDVPLIDPVMGGRLIRTNDIHKLDVVLATGPDSTATPLPLPVLQDA